MTCLGDRAITQKKELRINNEASPFFPIPLLVFAFFLRIPSVKPLISIPCCQIRPCLNRIVFDASLKRQKSSDH